MRPISFFCIFCKFSATKEAFYFSVMSFMSMIGRFVWETVTDHFDKYVTSASFAVLQ